MAIARNPSFTPSPKLRDYINNSSEGTTATINNLFDRYSMLCEIDAIRLTPSEQNALAEMLQGVFIDSIAVQSVPQDVIETENAGLIDKLQGATFGQVLATLERYGYFSK